MSKSFLTAEWRNLLIVNYEINFALLKPYLPCQTELDSFNGVHYTSLVGFLFANTKVMGLSFPFHQTFEEVNLRFYVRYKKAGEWRRGVVFIKEIVPRCMVSFIANNLYGENYSTHRMKHIWRLTNKEFEVGYYWKVDNEWNYLKAWTEKEAQLIKQGSEEEFIIEHYWGYTFMKEDCTGIYQVLHPKWNIHKVKSFEIKCNADKLYGPAFAEVLSQPPTSVFLADGSAVTIMKRSKIFAALSS